ncbi:hypothetical protein GCM10023220_25120 [Streptomyces ziwulingensis]|uniref:Uncharacterized protein n=1 Tax=Streptomyces ziwulingensis TaxID=1045501 RepID=A0ABP9BQ40_9ACTN
MYRCEARTLLDSDVQATAELMPTAFDSIEWVSESVGEYLFRCEVEDVPHDHHAAFLRNGASSEPCTDVYLCWRDESGPQWLADGEVCLRAENPMASGCTIFRGHPGRCDWEYIDPSMVAAQAEADQSVREPGLPHLFTSPGKGGA